VAFQDGGQFLLAVDEANEHVVSLWEWQKGEKGQKIAETKVRILLKQISCSNK